MLYHFVPHSMCVLGVQVAEMLLRIGRAAANFTVAMSLTFVNMVEEVAKDMVRGTASTTTPVHVWFLTKVV